MTLELIRQSLDPLEHLDGGMNSMRKSAKMTARISLAFIILTLTLLVVSIINFGVSNSSPLILGMALIFSTIFFLNALQLANAAALLLSNLPSILVLAITIWLKKGAPGDDLHYYDSRMILIGFCALPGMIFSPREPVRMYGSATLSLLCLVLYDPIHEFFGVGYFQQGFPNATYYHINTIAVIISSSVIAGSIILKRIVVAEEDINRSLLAEKENQNQELETQNEEISSQTEQLTAAFALIESQKVMLEEYNSRLEELVDLKSNELQRSNEELHRYNSELRQFSYTVSHNLRAPVARLMGLSSLIKVDNDFTDDNRKMLGHIQDSANELDLIIRELSRIIDIRNDLYVVKEKVIFEEEWVHIYKSVEGQIDKNMDIQTDFSEAPFIYTIRPFLHSILYNLITNAIRYRSPNRPLIVKVKTTLAQGNIQISIHDNGMGINLKQFGKNLFGMYKRFHTHVQGRGLGLYLVKTQVEALHGTIQVESELNVGTQFLIEIKLPAEIEGQVCFDCEYGTILFNARSNTMGLLWKREVESDEYRTLLTKCLEMLHIYKTPRWIADLRKRGTLAPEDHAWFAEAILNEGSRNGLRRIACIDTTEQKELQRNAMLLSASRFKVEMRFFHTRREAETWIEE